jgi:hypothetical protein
MLVVLLLISAMQVAVVRFRVNRFAPRGLGLFQQGGRTLLRGKKLSSRGSHQGNSSEIMAQLSAQEWSERDERHRR